MTQCIEEGLLQAYIDDELPPTDRERVQTHLAGCPACTTRAAELRATAAQVDTLLADYTGTPDARAALAAAMQAASLAPATPARAAANVPIASPAAVASRGAVPRRGWGLAMAGFGVAAVVVLAFWLSGLLHVASQADDATLLGDVPADPVSRPAGSETPVPAGQALASFVPEGKVRHLVFEEATEGALTETVTEEVWLVNGPEYPLLYRTVSPSGEWQLVGNDAVWTYLGQRPGVQLHITRLTGVAASDSLIFKTAYDPLHIDRYVASERSMNDILNMPGASITASTISDRSATVLEYTRGTPLGLVPKVGRTPIVGFSSLSTDGDFLWGWEQPTTVYDPESGSTLWAALATPEIYHRPVQPTPNATRPAPSPEMLGSGGFQLQGPEIVDCRIWLDRDTFQVLQQTITRRMSGYKAGDNGTPVPVEQTIVETRKLVVDELLEPSAVPAGMFEPKVPEGFQVMELGHTFIRVLPARPTPDFLPTVTPIPYNP